MPRRIPSLLLLGVLTAIAVPSPRARADDPEPPPVEVGAPTATLHFRGRTAAAGVGFVWGGSTLEFNGETYPVRADGFVAGAVGTAALQGTGKVYGLTQLEDLNGGYTAVTAGGTFGRGLGTLAMRNDKGVRIVMDVQSRGLQLGIGPRGVTLEVGKRGEPPDTGARLPPTLGFGEAKLGSLYLRPTLNGQFFIAASRNPGFNGDWSAGPVDDAEDWTETSSEFGLNTRYLLGDEGAYGTLSTRVSGVVSRTGSGPDGSVCSPTRGGNQEVSLESAYLAWKSGPALPRLGEGGLEISGGNQNYQVFDGLLFWDGGQDCQDRGANWLSPRKAFHRTGIVTMNLDNWVLEAAHLKYNDTEPDTETQLGLGRVEYVTDEGPLEHLKLGLLYFKIYDSETESRNGMNGIYLHNEATPLRSLPGFTYKASWVREANSKSSGLSRAYGWYVAPAYEFSEATWKPKLGYRYASFSGGGTKAFDPLFAGLPEWGTWFQGELLGEYVLRSEEHTSELQSR